MKRNQRPISVRAQQGVVGEPKPCVGQNGYAVRKTTTATQTMPVDQNIDPEVVAFREDFEPRSPLDELVREGAWRML